MIACVCVRVCGVRVCVCVCVCAYECNLPSVRCGPRLTTTALFAKQCSAVQILCARVIALLLPRCALGSMTSCRLQCSVHCSVHGKTQCSVQCVWSVQRMCALPECVDGGVCLRTRSCMRACVFTCTCCLARDPDCLRHLRPRPPASLPPAPRRPFPVACGPTPHGPAARAHSRPPTP